jgi:serine/threonine-protein kinase
MPPTAAIVSSLVVFLAGRTSLSRERLLDLGLVHLVVVSFALAASQYWTAFEGLEAEMIDFDVIGFSGVAIWMLLYSVLVPSRPRRTLPFLLASAAAPPVVYALAVRYSTAPALGDRFFLALVFPNLATVCMAYVAVRIVYGLGREVSRARDVGSYRLERLLGQGGMGRVWRASHRLLARPAAVKLIRSDALGGGDRAHEAALARFEREARATASLRSLHTVELYDFGVTEDGSLYYAMELLEGMDLDRMVRRTGPLDPGRAVHLFRQACLSLAEAHDRGLVHRDIKPANLFVCRHGLECDVLKVLDFGLVRPSGADGAHEDSRGPMEGTPAFMAPEVASAGEEPDQRADLYSLGCTLFWALTGRVVFEADSLVEMLRAHASRAPGPPSRLGRGVPAPLDEITLRCLEKDPGDRFQSALELDAALEETGLGTGWTRETARRWWNDVGEPRRPRSSAGASAAPT